MAVITFHRDQVYESLDAVKSELSENVKSLAPLGLKEQVFVKKKKRKNPCILNDFHQFALHFRYRFYP